MIFNFKNLANFLITKGMKKNTDVFNSHLYIHQTRANYKVRSVHINNLIEIHIHDMIFENIDIACTGYIQENCHFFSFEYFVQTDNNTL